MLFFVSVGTLNLARGVSAATDIETVISDNNINPVMAPDFGGITIVNTVPALPPAIDETCSAPVASNNVPANPFLSAAGNVIHVAAAAAPAESGFSTDRALANWSASLRKLGRALSYTEGPQTIGASQSAADARPFAAAHAAPATAALTAMAGETVNVQVGTLRAGDSVTITFQVTVVDPSTAALPQVSNQGTVTADGGISVLSDDPSVPGASDPTVTPILLPPTIDINDATVTEPASGAANALFTVSLSHPFTQTVTVNFTTAVGGANPATAGTDYTTTSGTVSFNAGETVQTASVPALADGDAGEADETFLVNLNGAVNGVIGDGQATGSITDDSVASAVIISELRTSGPGGAGDDFVELLNTTDSDITVAASDGSTGWSIVKVYSDEDDGTGNHSPDAVDIGLGTLRLRRERDGGGNGRVYLIVVKATDGSGNTAASCRTVTVPHSNSGSSHTAVAAQAAAAASFCSANNGAPPAGYFAVGQ